MKYFLLIALTFVYIGCAGTKAPEVEYKSVWQQTQPDMTLGELELLRPVIILNHTGDFLQVQHLTRSQVVFVNRILNKDVQFDTVSALPCYIRVRAITDKEVSAWSRLLWIE